MKRLHTIVYVLILLIGCISVASAQVISIPDANLAAAVRESLGLAAGAPLTQPDMHRLTALSRLNAEINNLTGLEHATNLEILLLRANNISNLIPLAGLTQLKMLWLGENQISDISPLAKLTNLENLWLEANRISDITPLTGLTQLVQLSLWENQISDITPLEGLTKLEVLSLGTNQISDLEPLTDLKEVNTLILSENEIDDILPLAQLPKVSTLWLSSNNIKDIRPLTQLSELEVLSVESNRITDASPLLSVKRLRALDIQGNPITDSALLDILAKLDGTQEEPISTLIPTRVVSRRTPTPSPVALDRVIFNEIYNATDDENDWIELKNISEEAVSLSDWEISIVSESGEPPDQDIVAFPNYELPAGGILLITNTTPSSSDLIRGQDIANADSKPDIPPQYLVAPDMKLPETRYLLILRSATDKNGKPEAFEDVAGTYFRYTYQYEKPEDPEAFEGDYIGQTDAYLTSVWPLQETPNPTNRAALTAGKVWKRVAVDKRGYEAEAWAESGYQQGIGYKPKAYKYTSFGTPGYPNDAVISDVSATGQVSFSELMFTSRGGLRSLSQWIELYNNSDTEAVKLKGWTLEIEARDADDTRRHGVVTLADLSILPNQTVLIVTWIGQNSGHFPEGHVYNFFNHHSGDFEQNRHRNMVLSAEGFSLKLSDADGTLVDVAGNLDDDSSTTDEPAWELPSGTTESGARTSIIRRYEERLPLDGTLSTSWHRASETQVGIKTYWGRETDIGSPGYRAGGILPVGLSSFRSERTNTNVVLITWTTESETNNAGFNILRSQSRQGPFVKVNPALILGAGTTSERQTYTWRDTAAKPNVAYFYQIEDLSFSGNTQRLATVRMRGHISASGKLNATWGKLKAQE